VSDAAKPSPIERPRVLVVDEEPAIVRAVKAGLEARGYRVAVASRGLDAVSAIAANPPAVVLLDLGLPDIDGLEVIRRVRQWTWVPIVVLTADGHEQRKVIALDEGADDYITKPFSMPELLARVRVAIRHHTHRQTGPDESVLEVGDLVIDVAHHRCTVGGREVDLTPKEFGFVSLLARWPGRVLTHRMILHEVWGPEYEKETQYLRTYATNIRKKLGDGPDHQRLVAKPGVGYTLLDPAAASAA
jgi:two-component system KDP operon response regulator KdpE